MISIGHAMLKYAKLDVTVTKFMRMRGEPSALKWRAYRANA